MSFIAPKKNSNARRQGRALCHKTGTLVCTQDNSSTDLLFPQRLLYTLAVTPAAFLLTPAVVRGAPGVGVRVHKRTSAALAVIQVLKNIPSIVSVRGNLSVELIYISNSAFVPWFWQDTPCLLLDSVFSEREVLCRGRADQNPAPSTGRRTSEAYRHGVFAGIHAHEGHINTCGVVRFDFAERGPQNLSRR